MPRKYTPKPPSPNNNNEVVNIRVPELLFALEHHGQGYYRNGGVAYGPAGHGWGSLEDLDKDVGFSVGYIRKSIDRGYMSFYFLDRLSCYLGSHPSRFVDGMYVKEQIPA